MSNENMNLEDAVEQIKDYYTRSSRKGKKWVHKFDKKALQEAIENSEISDTIHEIADSNVDIYNYNLLEWVKDNYNYVEDAISEFGHATDDEGKPDFIKQIMQGQYQANQEVLYEALEQIKEELQI